MLEYLQLNRGDKISIDNEALNELMEERGAGNLYHLFTILKKDLIRSEVAEYYIFDLDHEDSDEHDGEGLKMVIKVVDENYDFRFYFIPDWVKIEGGSRNDYIENGFQFLFQEPEDPDNFIPSKLLYAEEFDSGDGIFKKKTISEDGRNEEEHLSTVVEYQYHHEKEDCTVNEVFITEIGGENSENGGWFTYHEGFILEAGELKVED